MKNRLFKKIFLSTAAALILSLITIMILLSFSVNSYLVREKKALLTDNCKTISDVLSNETDNTTSFYISLNGIIKVVSEAVSGEAYVSDTDGNVFLCSCREWKNEKTCIHANGKIPQNVLDTASEGSYFEVGNLGDRFRNTYYTAAMPFYSTDGSIAGYVYISSPAALLKDMWSELSDIYILCAAIPVTLLFIFLFFMTRKITRPIHLMSEAAENMSKGDFSKRIPIDGNDEISDLADTFNTMSNSLSQLESMRRSFVANVSHELRTPMTTIGGFIDGILDGTIPPEKRDYYLNVVSSEVKRLSRLVHSMLSLSKLESGEQKVQPTEFVLTDLICEVLISQEQRIDEKNINITGLDSGNDVKLTADRDLIYQAIYNLTDNAIKFTPDGGCIEFGVSKEKDGVHFKVCNDGKGIKPEELQFVFDRFYKTDKSRSVNKDGVGLGLYIVKTIIDIHKGNITVRSEPDRFTEFEIIFPA